MRPTTRTLSIVANAIAQKTGISVIFKGSQASTNGKSITIPTMPDDDDEAVLLTSGYLDHEVGHCRHTSFNVQKPAGGMHRSFYQAIEDCRMETLQGNEYPGSRKNLFNLVTHLADQSDPPTFFRAMSPKDDPATMLQAYVLQRGRLKHVGQTGLAAAYETTRSVIRKTLPSDLVDQIDQIVDELPAMTSTGESVDASNRIMKAIQDAQQSGNDNDPGEAGEPSDSGGDSESDEPTTGDPSDPDSNDDGSDGDDNGQEDGQGPGSSDSGDPSDGSSDDASGPNAGGADNSQGPSSNGSVDDEADNLDRLKASANGDTEEGNDCEQNLGEVVAQELSEHATDGPEATRGTFVGAGADHASKNSVLTIDRDKSRQATVRLRKRLTSMLETQAKTRSRHSRAGVKIDRRRLPTIGHPNAAVFHTRRKRPSLSTAAHVLVDRSGSMDRDNRIYRAGEAAYALMSAMDNVEGLTTACSAFPGFGEMAVTHVTRSDETLRRTRHRYIPVSNGGTPLAEAIWTCGTDLRAQKVNRRLLIVITDGMPSEIEPSCLAIHRMRKAGIECLGVGINANTADIFGIRWSTRIDDINELAPNLFGIMQNMLKAA